MSDQGERLLTWLHLSDIHCGQGNALETALRKDTLNRLIEDAATALRKHALTLDFCLITGDLYQRGGTTTAEREELDALLDAIREELKPKEGFYLVPGNHDVDRHSGMSDNDVKEWFDDLRSDSASAIDDALGDAAKSAIIRERFRAYLDLTERDDINPGVVELTPLSWERIWNLDGQTVRLRGANSAYLCNDDHDATTLQIPVVALGLPRSRSAEVALVAFHHPLEWCRNAQTARRLVSGFDVLLTGHTHQAAADGRHTPSKLNSVHISAGATYEPNEKERTWKRIEDYRYSICALSRLSDSRVSLVQWPRRWRANARDFVADTELTDGDEIFCAWPLGATQASPPPPPAGSATLLSSARAMEQYGSHRTAFPSDLSLLELAEKDLLVPSRLEHAGGVIAVEGLAADAAAGRNILVLGAPGSGKSVTLFEIARQLQGMGEVPLPMRFSSLRRLFKSKGGPERGLDYNRNGRKPIFLVDGLDEASVTNSLGPKAISEWLNTIAEDFTLVLSCREAEYETQLSAYVSNISFSRIAQMRAWDVENEFKSLINRVVAAGLLPDHALWESVNADADLKNLASRPLFARMLCFVHSESKRDLRREIRSVEDLYARFFDVHERRTRAGLNDIGCSPENARDVWTASAWHTFRLDLMEDETIQYATLLTALRNIEPRDECLTRTLSAILDTSSSAWRHEANYVHYSFFEYLLSSALHERLIGAKSVIDDDETLSVFQKDIPRRVRHFTTNRLRLQDGGHGKARLLEAFDGLRIRSTVDSRRTASNLIAYLLSRVYGAIPELRDRLASETDLFICNSLFWGLAHAGDLESTADFIVSLQSSAEHLQMCRGYLLYYHGDLGFETEPPFLDAPTPEFPAWTRTRAALFELLGGTKYSKDVHVARRIIDVYTLKSFLSARADAPTPDERAILDKRIEEILCECKEPWVSPALKES